MRKTTSNIRKLLPVASALAVVGAAILLNRSAYAGEPLPTVPHVDLTRYQGKWYEIARLPLYWENKCDSNVTATYTLQSDGKVTVLNECKKKDGSLTESRGTAEVAGGNKSGDNSNSKLKVSFFWPFKGDYWILDLDPDYRWVLVGTPNLKNLWVLSRTQQLDKPILDKLTDQARHLGFDTSKLIYTRQK